MTGIDQGRYAQSWEKSDPLFQNTITQSEWEKALNLARKNKGATKSRKIIAQDPAWNPNGLPEGAYMVIQYETSFTNDPNSNEMVTLRLGSDGKWRPLTYDFK